MQRHHGHETQGARSERNNTAWEERRKRRSRVTWEKPRGRCGSQGRRNGRTGIRHWNKTEEGYAQRNLTVEGMKDEWNALDESNVKLTCVRARDPGLEMHPNLSHHSCKRRNRCGRGEGLSEARTTGNCKAYDAIGFCEIDPFLLHTPLAST